MRVKYTNVTRISNNSVLNTKLWNFQLSSIWHSLSTLRIVILISSDLSVKRQTTHSKTVTNDLPPIFFTSYNIVTDLVLVKSPFLLKDFCQHKKLRFWQHNRVEYYNIYCSCLRHPSPTHHWPISEKFFFTSLMLQLLLRSYYVRIPIKRVLINRTLLFTWREVSS